MGILLLLLLLDPNYTKYKRLSGLEEEKFHVQLNAVATDSIICLPYIYSIKFKGLKSREVIQYVSISVKHSNFTKRNIVNSAISKIEGGIQLDKILLHTKDKANN